MDARGVAVKIADYIENEFAFIPGSPRETFIERVINIIHEEGPTKEQIHILQHALGITDGHAEYRNYYAVEDGEKDCEALVAAGLMVKSHGVPGYDKLSWSLVYYHVTDAGKKVSYANYRR